MLFIEDFNQSSSGVYVFILLCCDRTEELTGIATSQKVEAYFYGLLIMGTLCISLDLSLIIFSVDNFSVDNFSVILLSKTSK